MRAGGWKVVIVGAGDHPGHYVRGFETFAAATPGVVMTGFRSGTALAELYAHAGLFVLPSSHEGLPMVLLEATVAGLPVLAGDIPANREIQLPERCYFGVGEIASLADRIREATARPLTGRDKAARRGIMVERYSWGPIAERTGRLSRSNEVTPSRPFRLDLIMDHHDRPHCFAHIADRPVRPSRGDAC